VMTSRLSENTSTFGSVSIWWEASCGATHYEVNPVGVDWYCPVDMDRRGLMRRLADEIVGRYSRALDRLAGRP
jgi:hypothetical protein